MNLDLIKKNMKKAIKTLFYDKKLTKIVLAIEASVSASHTFVSRCHGARSRQCRATPGTTEGQHAARGAQTTLHTPATKITCGQWTL